MDTTAALAVAAAVGGAAGTPFLAARGLREVQRLTTADPWFTPTVGAVGAAASITIVIFADGRAASFPALLVWGCALVAIAACDALTQRIPTALARQSILAVALLLVSGGLVSGNWEPVAHSAGWAAAAGAALFGAHRFAGTGAGDVRLAVLGGLGLMSATASSVLIGVAVWGAFAVAQAFISLARGGSLRTRVALGPGLASAFLTAVLLPV